MKGPQLCIGVRAEASCPSHERINDVSDDLSHLDVRIELRRTIHDPRLTTWCNLKVGVRKKPTIARLSSKAVALLTEL